MPDQRSANILVVDDNPATRYSTSRFLKSAGFNILEAATGSEALTLAEQSPQLVILDVNLPDISGFEVCRVLRSRPNTAQTPILHLSASYVGNADKIHGLEAGADGYLTHPIEPPMLIATVNAFLRARHAEEGMKRNEEKFRAIFDQALNGITLISPELLYMEVNPAMCRIIGRSREEIIGKHTSAFVPKSHETQLVAVARALETNGVWRGIYPLIRDDGTLVQLDWNISIHSLPGVRLAIVTDVTERMRIEEEKEILLASEKAARADAERANRLKDDFLATLSHELRTPLNAIVGWSHLLKRDHSDREMLEEGLNAIERNATAQAQLISDLLDVSRITSGKMRLDLQAVDPVAVIEAAIESVIPAAAAKEIRIKRCFDGNGRLMTADPSRLQQVMWNLVNNAVKFTPKQGLITVTLRRDSQYIEIEVSDNGQGISQDFLPYLFERFRQADAGTTRSHGGLGLGLAIVKHLVEMHGGTVTAESAGAGKGTAITVRIPVAPGLTVASQDDSPAQSAEPSRAKPQVPPSKSLSGLHILVVDDDPDARQLLRRILRDAGGEVLDVSSASEALAAIDSTILNVIVSDIGMPGQDGFELMRRVRSRGFTADHLPAIALTAFARAEDCAEALRAGYQVHLAKPIKPDELLLTIAAMVRQPVKSAAIGE